jgi:hypothetical protein|eukprot:COSAG01_NODE_147_length_24095_cov_25.855428_11_plen_103_part_00
MLDNIQMDFHKRCRTSKAMTTSCASCPALPARVFGITSRASANASTPSHNSKPMCQLHLGVRAHGQHAGSPSFWRPSTSNMYFFKSAAHATSKAPAPTISEM